MRLTVLLNIFLSTLLCQVHLDKLIQEVLSGSKDSAAIYLPLIETKYPNNPNMLFLKGLMETDGEKAMQIFIMVMSLAQLEVESFQRILKLRGQRFKGSEK